MVRSNKEINLSAEELRRLLHYNPETGIFTRLVAAPRSPVGYEITCLSVKGYIYVGLNGQRYTAHRLAWLYMTSEWPPLDVDHIDGDRANNKWINLRAATRAENLRNTKVRKDNTLGLKGIRLTRQGKYSARITFNRQRFNLGVFNSASEAGDAYLKASREMHGEFGRTK